MHVPFVCTFFFLLKLFQSDLDLRVDTYGKRIRINTFAMMMDSCPVLQ